MQGKITIIDGNDQITLSEIKDNIKAYMVKGEPGNDGVSPVITTTRTGKVTTITIVDKDGTKQAILNDGVSPTVTTTETTGKVDLSITDIDGTRTTTISDPVIGLSKTNGVATITVTDAEGSRTTSIADGIDLTGGVPTNGIIGFDGVSADIPDGYEEVDMEVSYNITNFPEHSSGTNSYSLKRTGNIVFLNVNRIYFNSISANTNLSLGTLPADVIPSENIITLASIEPESAGISSIGRVVIRAAGDMQLISSSSYSSVRSARFSATWLLS